MSADILLHLCGRTDVGRARDHNEDAYIVADLSTDESGRPTEVRSGPLGPRGTLLMVADGMGGAAAGEVASALATETVVAELRTRWTAADAGDPESFVRALREATEAANVRIHGHARENPGTRGMGTTATAVGLLGGVAYLAQVGDSRAYLVRGGAATLLTKDQSLMQRLIDAGELSEEEAAVSERRNIILQALGPEAHIKVDLTVQRLCAGDTLVVCSDGLSGQVRRDEIASIVSGTRDLAAACAALIDRANAAGGPDNITVIAARVEGPALPGDDPEPPGHRPYVGEQSARTTQPLDRASLAAIQAIPDDLDTPQAASAEPAVARVEPAPDAPGAPPSRSSAALDAADEALLSPRAAVALLVVGALLVAGWLLR